MPLESLLELVETLRVRIDTHGSALRQSEALTRYALIDPLLRELGWDTSDPDMVVPEYRSGAGSADYALLSSGSPAMMVEAKKLGTPLQGVLTQGIGYCITEGIEYFSVTDGQRWEVYETHKPVPIDEKRIASWDLKDTSLGEVCLKVLALWRPSVQSGYVAAGEAPVVGSAPSQPAITTTQTTATPLDEHEWQPVSDLIMIKGNLRPTEILFPNGNRATLASWNATLIEITHWLIDNGILNTPIPASKSGKLIVSTEPLHSDGSPIMNPVEINGWFISKHGSAKTIIQRTKRIIEHVGQDPAQFKVRFA